jgi:hypothetical protein
MCLGPTGEVVTLHPTGESLTFGYADYIHHIPGLEHRHVDPLAYLGISEVVHPELPQMPQRGPSFQMTSLRLVDLLGLFIANLYRLVAVPLPGLYLSNHAGPSLNDANRLHHAIL